MTKPNKSASAGKPGGGANVLKDALQFVSPKDIAEAQHDYQSLRHQEVALGREISDVLREPSNADLEAQLQGEQAAVQELERRLVETKTRIANASTKTVRRPQQPHSNHRSQQPPPPPRSSNQRHTTKRFNVMRAHWKSRKEKCMDFVDQLADGMEKKVKDIVKLLELETDEAHGISRLPPKKQAA